jgi:hypothetical protein
MSLSGFSASRAPRGASAASLLWRLPLATALVLLAAHLWSHDLLVQLKPVLSWALETAADDFTVLQFDFAKDRGNDSLVALAQLKRTLMFGSTAVVPDGVTAMAVGSATGNVLQPMLVALVLMLAWPAHLLEMAVRLAIGTALQAGVLLINTPLSMAAWLWFAHLQRYAPDQWSALVWWNIFLNGGGRLVLGLVSAVLAIAIARRWAARAKRSRNVSAG